MMFQVFKAKRRQRKAKRKKRWKKEQKSKTMLNASRHAFWCAAHETVPADKKPNKM